jgi:hypothetical protein
VLRFADMLDSFALPLTLPDFDLFAVWHARFENDPGHAWLREKIAACLADEASFAREPQ